MKKIISKILIILIIIIMLFEFTCSSNISYAAVSSSTTEKLVKNITNLMGGLVSIILWIPRIKATVIAFSASKIVTTNLAESCGISDDPIFIGTDGNVATPFDIFFNKYNLLDVNFFDINIYEISDDNTIIENIRIQVATWFYIMRTFAAFILLCILIYVGIRMAISTVSEDKAKYKKMLVDWCCSLALIFVLHYIAIFTIYANNAIVNFLRQMPCASIESAMDRMMMQATLSIGISSIVATISYCMITFQTLAFLIAYIQRMLKVAFLIIISPLISITYSIDKMGDGKAQALNQWLKEFVYTILIQPFHCVMYLAFVNIAITLIETAPAGPFSSLIGMFGDDFNQLVNGFLVILCFKFINDGEQVVRKIFNFQDSGDMTSMAAGAAVGMAAFSKLKGAKNTGSNIAKSINSKTGFASKLKKNWAKDKGKFGDLAKKAADKVGLGNVYDKVADKTKKAGEFIDKVKAKTLNSKFTRTIKKGTKRVRDMKNKVNNKINSNRFARFAKRMYKKSTPMALALLAGSMAFAGGSGAMLSIGIADGAKEAAEGYMTNSGNTLEEEGSNQVESEAKERLEGDEGYKEACSSLDKAKKDAGDIDGKTKKVNKDIKDIKKSSGMTNDEFTGYSKKFEEARQAKKEAKQILKNPESSAEARKEALEKQKQAEKDLKELQKQNKPLYSKLLEKERLEEKKQNIEDLTAKKEDCRKKIVEDVVKKFKQSGGAEKIASAKNEITRMIQAAMIKGEGQEGGDTDTDNHLTQEQTDSAERMQKTICDLVDRSVIGSGASFDAADFVSKNFEGCDTDMSQNLVAAIESYQYQKRAAEFNNSRSTYKNFGGFVDKFDDDCTRKVTGRLG